MIYSDWIGTPGLFYIDCKAVGTIFGLGGGGGKKNFAAQNFLF